MFVPFSFGGFEPSWKTPHHQIHHHHNNIIHKTTHNTHHTAAFSFWGMGALPLILLTSYYILILCSYSHALALHVICLLFYHEVVFFSP